MTVGIPGTGIGGLFYLTLALAMPVRELWLTVRGRSSLARWRIVAYQWGIAAGILGALWGQAWLLGLAARALERSAPTGVLALAARQVASDSASIFGHTAAAGFIVLALILATVHAARLAVRWDDRRKMRGAESGPRATIAAAGGEG